MGRRKGSVSFKPEPIKCKECDKLIDFEDEEIRIMKRISWKDYILYRGKQVKLWHFCNRTCQFKFIDNRGQRYLEKKRRNAKELRDEKERKHRKV